MKARLLALLLTSAFCLCAPCAAPAGQRGDAAVATSDKDAPGGPDTAAVITYAAESSPSHHVISGIAWSYSGGTPSGGNLQIEDGAGNVVFSMDITAAGAGFIPFDPPKRGSENRAMIITLAAGGASVTGKVSVLAHWVN